MKAAGPATMIGAMKPHQLILALGLVSAALVGCENSRWNWEAGSAGPMIMTVAKGGQEQAWDETLDVLRESCFEPDRQDYRAGVIVTRLTVSQQKIGRASCRERVFAVV